MATLYKRYFGELKGKFGDAVFKKLGDNNYVARKPRYKKPDTEEFHMRTTAFKLSGKLASLINANSYLKSIWRNRLGKNVQLYPRLISVNYNVFKNGSISETLQLVPEGGFGVRFDSMTISENELSLKIKALTINSSVDPSVEKKIRAVTFLILSNPLIETQMPIRIIQLTSAPITTDLLTDLTFTYQIFTADKDYLDAYQNKNYFSALITFDDSNRSIKYSNTFTTQS